MPAPTQQEVQSAIDGVVQSLTSLLNSFNGVQAPAAPQPSGNCSTELAFKNAAEAVHNTMQTAYYNAVAVSDTIAAALVITEAAKDAAAQVYNECVTANSGGGSG